MWAKKKKQTKQLPNDSEELECIRRRCSCTSQTQPRSVFSFICYFNLIFFLPFFFFFCFSGNPEAVFLITGFCIYLSEFFFFSPLLNGALLPTPADTGESKKDTGWEPEAKSDTHMNRGGAEIQLTRGDRPFFADRWLKTTEVRETSSVHIYLPVQEATEGSD